MSLLEKILGIPGRTTSISVSQLSAFLSSTTKESRHYEFKEITDRDFRSIYLGESVSAFVNSQEGGLLFIGFEDPDEVQRMPVKIHWLDRTNPRLSYSALRNKLNDSVQPIADFEIIDILSEDNPNKVAYIVEILPSSPFPCMNLYDKKYYRRQESNNISLDHNQVLTLFNQRKVPVLTLDLDWATSSQDSKEVVFRLRVKAKNSGKVTAELVSCQINFTEGERYAERSPRSHMASDDPCFFIPISASNFISNTQAQFHIHPGEKVDLGWLCIKLPQGEEKTLKMEVTVFSKDAAPTPAIFLVKTTSPSPGLSIEQVA